MGVLGVIRREADLGRCGVIEDVPPRNKPTADQLSRPDETAQRLDTENLVDRFAQQASRDPGDGSAEGSSIPDGEPETSSS
jgi:hypothetical protein